MNEFVCFGQHLMMEGYKADEYMLSDIDVVYDFLNECPNLINMTKITTPYVMKYNADNMEDSGLSGFVIIAQSHISIHTFPEKKFLSVDIFSCEEFNTDLAIKYIKETFDVKKEEINIINRGLEFPRNINLVKNIVTRQRNEL